MLRFDPVSAPRVLLTGASGFLGNHLLLALLERGVIVRAQVRSERARSRLSRLADTEAATACPVDFVHADLCQDAGWATACAGCEAVIHVASPFPERQPADADELLLPAVDGTRRVLEAARAAGVTRVVATSSASAVIYGRSGAPFSETDWTDPGSRAATPYVRAKTLAERTAWDIADRQGIQLSVLNPGLILGPLMDANPNTSVGMVRKLLLGEYPGLPDIGFPIADVRDVAQAHVDALLEPGAIGGRFLLGDDFQTLAQIAHRLRRLAPDFAKSIPRRVLSHWMVKLIARFDADARGIVGQLGHDGSLSTTKARSVLGWSPRPLDATLSDTVDGLRRFGFLDRRAPAGES
jgi:nucleoside-diphosphate-sugar epimerase